MAAVKVRDIQEAASDIQETVNNEVSDVTHSADRSGSETVMKVTNFVEVGTEAADYVQVKHVAVSAEDLIPRPLIPSQDNLILSHSYSVQALSQATVSLHATEDRLPELTPASSMRENLSSRVARKRARGRRRADADQSQYGIYY